MKLKTISNFNFKNKTVLLRSDLNSPIINGKLQNSERFKESAVTINELKRKKAKIIILAHQGQPGKKDFASLKNHPKILNKYTKVKFIKDIVGKKALTEIRNLKPGQVILLENIRFSKNEFQSKKNSLSKTLASLADIYVNDAFSVCHRNHTSISVLPKHLPSCIGRLFEKELKALEKIKLKKALYILGGAKLNSNVKLLGKNKVLPGGLFAPLCSITSGVNLGKSNKILKRYFPLKKQIRKHLKRIILPVDYAVPIKQKRTNILIKQFPQNQLALDIGDKTIEIYKKEIRKAKSIYMKGPAGRYSKKGFEKGTIEILKAISKSKAFSLIGGGHLNNAMAKYKINKNKFNHVSLSGGALLDYIAGEKLPGLEALKKRG